MGRRPCCSKVGLNRGAWSPREDRILINYISKHGEGKWRDLPKKAGLQRCGKSCRLRWLNYLRPDIKRGNISPDEEDLIIRLHKLLGNRWSIIAGRLPGRTDNEIKNYWNTNLSKKVKTQSTSPTTRKNPNRSEEKKKKTLPTKTWTEAAPLACKAHQAIRTKAVRCTKAVLPLHDQDCGIMKSVQRTCCESPPMMSQDDDGSLNFWMDFDVEQLLAFDGPDSNTSQACAAADEINRNCAGIRQDDGAHDLSSCYDDSFLLDSAIVEDWRGDDSLLSDVAFDLEIGSFDILV